MLLIKNANIYAPEYLGKKDILVCGEKIEYMADAIDVPNVPCKVIDAEVGEAFKSIKVDGEEVLKIERQEYYDVDISTEEKVKKYTI